MKFRRLHVGQEDTIELQMTPMIDIVFQLLVFFIMTFKIVAQEGDFNVKMPLTAPNAGVPDDTMLPPLKLELSADSEGRLLADGIRVGTQIFEDFDGLHQFVRRFIEDQSGPGSVSEAEVEIDCDYQLRYSYVIQAITAVSGYIDGDGNVIKLIEKIKFSPPQSPPTG